MASEFEQSHIDGRDDPFDGFLAGLREKHFVTVLPKQEHEELEVGLFVLHQFVSRRRQHAHGRCAPAPATWMSRWDYRSRV